MIGRFIQADTIVPGGVQGLDRYAYVFNHPLTNIDPTGHFCTKVGPNTICSADDDSLGWWQPIDTVELSDGGTQMWQLYLQYRDTTPGWWNNNTLGTLTTEQFVGMYILFESTTGYRDTTLNAADTLSIIFAQNLYMGGWNDPVCTYGGTCVYEVFNFIGANIDGNSALLKGPNNINNKLFDKYNPGLGTPDVIRNRINTLGTNALDPNSVIGGRNDGPSIWGNINGADVIYEILSKNGTQVIQFGKAVDTIYYLVYSAVYMSIDQYNYWNLSVDMTLIR